MDRKNYSELYSSEKASLFSGDLKEIAGRLNKLSYRDMNTLAGLISHQMQKEGLTVTDAILFASDHIGGK